MSLKKDLKQKSCRYESRKAISCVWWRREKVRSGKHGGNWLPKIGILVKDQVTL